MTERELKGESPLPPAFCDEREEGDSPTKHGYCNPHERESVESYIEKGKAIRLARPKSCPSCQGTHFIFWSGYYRYLSSREGEFRVFIRRVRCGKCSKTLEAHSLVPAAKQAFHR